MRMIDEDVGGRPSAEEIFDAGAEAGEGEGMRRGKDKRVEKRDRMRWGKEHKGMRNGRDVSGEWKASIS